MEESILPSPTSPWSDGTSVRFTDAARTIMSRPARNPEDNPIGGYDRTYTITNTKDGWGGVILNETGERWGSFWLEEA